MWVGGWEEGVSVCVVGGVEGVSVSVERVSVCMGGGDRGRADVGRLVGRQGGRGLGETSLRALPGGR